MSIRHLNEASHHYMSFGYLQVNNIITYLLVENIRIYHECEGRIEKSVPRIAVWHHEACRVMTNRELHGRIFLSYPYTNNGFFFLLTTVFFLISLT